MKNIQLFFFLIFITFSSTAQSGFAEIVIFRKAKFSGGLSSIIVENADSLLFRVKSNKALIFRIPAGEYKLNSYLDAGSRSSKPVEWKFSVVSNETKYFDFDTKAALPVGLPVVTEISQNEFQKFLVENPKWKSRIENAEKVSF